MILPFPGPLRCGVEIFSSFYLNRFGQFDRVVLIVSKAPLPVRSYAGKKEINRAN